MLTPRIRLLHSHPVAQLFLAQLLSEFCCQACCLCLLLLLSFLLGSNLNAHDLPGKQGAARRLTQNSNTNTLHPTLTVRLHLTPYPGATPTGVVLPLGIRVLNQNPPKNPHVRSRPRLRLFEAAPCTLHIGLEADSNTSKSPQYNPLPRPPS
jgi:hypothetical protein